MQRSLGDHKSECDVELMDTMGQSFALFLETRANQQVDIFVKSQAPVHSDT